MVLLILPPDIRSSLGLKETIKGLSLTQSARITVKHLFAIMRLLDLLPSSSPMGKVSLATMTTNANGKALTFNRMITGEIPSFGLTKVSFLLKLPMSSPSMDGVPAELMKVSKW